MRPRRKVFLKDPATIGTVKRMFSRMEVPHKTTLVRAINQIIESPQRKKEIMIGLNQAERIIVGHILSRISGNRLRESDFI